MQKISEVLTYEGYTREQFTQLISLALDSLNWQHVINENEIESETRSTLWSWGEIVTVQVYDNEAWVTSMYHKWQLPIGNKIKKNIEALRAAILSVQTQLPPEEIEEANIQIVAKEEHVFDFEKKFDNPTATTENKKSAFGLGTSYVTYTLIFIILAVFAIMALNGVSLFEPTGEDIFIWGGNYYPYTTSGDYWRLITSVFVHIGIIHLALNAYALFFIGNQLEPVIGRTKYFLCFILTGVLASTFSMWWDGNRISAGASGAIFGLYGVFLSLMITGYVNKKVRSALLSSVCIFIVINLIYGIKDGIDNAAHIGGLISGFLIGLLLVAEVKWKQYKQLIKLSSICIPIIVIAMYIKTVHTKDADFNMKLIDIAMLDSNADWLIESGDGKSDNQLAGDMERTCIPNWTKVSEILGNYKSSDLGNFNAKLHSVLVDYTKLRLRETALYIQKADDSAHYNPIEMQTLKETIAAKKLELINLKQ